MPTIKVVERTTKISSIEPVYGGWALDFVYGDTLLSRVIGRTLLHLLLKTAPFSWLYGLWQKSGFSKKKVLPFIEKYNVDPSEFLNPPESFPSFNSFFVRKLKKESRPIASSPLVIPADGRYRFIPNISEADGFLVKGKKFHLSSLLKDPTLAERYEGGSMVIARLCPTDYHRFHFPCDGKAKHPILINGWLYSVNPTATQKTIEIFTENKRALTLIETESFGLLCYIEVGATCVGSIEQTFSPGKYHQKGEEKGTFAFGASSLILLFEPETIQFDADLLELSQDYQEIRCLMGQSMAQKL